METDEAVPVIGNKSEERQEDQPNSTNDSDSAVELWWETFLKQKRAEDALDAELRAAWENCSQRRLKFAREVQKITELYQPIEKLLHTVLESDKMHRGDNLYREWDLKDRCIVLWVELFRLIFSMRSVKSMSSGHLYRLVKQFTMTEE
ncbi:unnamed protein product [Echinostoma caproni]|uniref:DUF4455 domain-containing protein n=1 Tax=Echinostoma caproni TaxID=27848 RepID=A0A183AXZ6_9TREM|nr:unnamed protein product [Echinostoma caproni]